MRINNTASFDAENAESVQESSDTCVGSAILAYVINSKFMAVLHKPVRDCSQNMPRTDWMSKTLEQGSDIIHP